MPTPRLVFTAMPVAVLTAAIAQGAWMTAASAADAASQPASAEPSAAVGDAAPSPQAQTQEPAESQADMARARSEERRAAMDAAREKRYAELRANAAQLGVTLPETPPWRRTEQAMPPRPDMPQRHARPSQEEREAALAKRQAAREERWKQMQAAAAERGFDRAETPPWEGMNERRQEMAERFERYRETIDAMTEEQRQAAQAVFGRPPAMPSWRMPYSGPADQSWEHFCPPGTYGMPYPPMMPPHYDAPRADQGPPPPPADGTTR